MLTEDFIDSVLARLEADPGLAAAFREADSRVSALHVLKNAGVSIPADFYANRELSAGELERIVGSTGHNWS